MTKCNDLMIQEYIEHFPKDTCLGELWYHLAQSDTLNNQVLLQHEQHCEGTHGLSVVPAETPVWQPPALTGDFLKTSGN